MYDDFAATFGRRHLSLGEYEHRRGVYHENRAFIDDWNAQATEADSHMLKLNQFADWSQVSMLWNNCVLLVEVKPGVVCRVANCQCKHPCGRSPCCR